MVAGVMVIQDLIATLISFTGATLWLRWMDSLAFKGVLDSKLSRKIIHIGTGPLFCLSWVLFTDAPLARYLAALIPLLLTIRLVAVSLGLLQDPATVQSLTRTGNPAEILRGPLYYGIAIIFCTVLFWRQSPIGILALMMMCGGDGLADIVGRRWGHHKLPFNVEKSWIGSLAMLGGSFGLGFSFIVIFNGLGYWQPSLNLLEAAGATLIIAIAATLVEALPFREIDNLTLTGTALLLGLWLF